jgi:hypothetical protein
MTFIHLQVRLLTTLRHLHNFCATNDSFYLPRIMMRFFPKWKGNTKWYYPSVCRNENNFLSTRLWRTKQPPTTHGCVMCCLTLPAGKISRNNARKESAKLLGVSQTLADTSSRSVESKLVKWLARDLWLMTEKGKTDETKRSYYITYEGVSKSFRTGLLEHEL